MDTDAENQSDDEICTLILPQRRQIRLRPNYFQIWSDGEFYNRFRMGKQTANIIIAQIAPIVKNTTNWNCALSVEQMLLITLRFYASGCMLISLGDFFGVSKATASKVIKKVSLAICSLREQYIRFPENEMEMNKVAAGFYRIAKFPRVIAAIDCTHVRIQSPGGQDGEVFRNRKGYFSMNVQAVTDSNLNILDVVARWPGSAHDSTIFANSRICGKFEAGQFGNKIILGDGGYMNKPYLLTPLRTCSSSAQTKYNSAQISTRNPVERLFGVWKRRFPILALGIRLNIHKVQSIVVATAILHNICNQQREFPVPPLNEAMEREIMYTLNMTNDYLLPENDIGTSRQAMIAYFEEI